MVGFWEMGASGCAECLLRKGEGSQKEVIGEFEGVGGLSIHPLQGQGDAKLEEEVLES